MRNSINQENLYKELKMAYDNYELAKLIELHKKLLYDDKKRLGLLQDSGIQVLF